VVEALVVNDLLIKGWKVVNVPVKNSKQLRKVKKALAPLGYEVRKPHYW
jgi:hypothetical protein